MTIIRIPDIVALEMLNEDKDEWIKNLKSDQDNCQGKLSATHSGHGKILDQMGKFSSESDRALNERRRLAPVPSSA
jgi:hypothetical protein